jgi:hypothetical protein
VEEAEFERGQEVWIEGRRASLLDVNPEGSPILRFEGEQVTRVVPRRKLRHRPPERQEERAAGAA